MKHEIKYNGHIMKFWRSWSGRVWLTIDGDFAFSGPMSKVFTVARFFR